MSKKPIIKDKNYELWKEAHATEEDKKRGKVTIRDIVNGLKKLFYCLFVAIIAFVILIFTGKSLNDTFTLLITTFLCVGSILLAGRIAGAYRDRSVMTAYTMSASSGDAKDRMRGVTDEGKFLMRIDTALVVAGLIIILAFVVLHLFTSFF